MANNNKIPRRKMYLRKGKKVPGLLLSHEEFVNLAECYYKAAHDMIRLQQNPYAIERDERMRILTIFYRMDKRLIEEIVTYKDVNNLLEYTEDYYMGKYQTEDIDFGDIKRVDSLPTINKKKEENEEEKRQRV